MKVSIMQPYAFPYLGYFQLIHSADEFVLLDDVNFINKGWINRNNILLNGTSHRFTLPLVKASQNKLIKEVGLNPEQAWKTKFLRTLEMAYKKAPHYNSTIALLESIFQEPTKSISDFNFIAIQKICNVLEITTKIHQTSSIFNQESKGSERILSICKELKATHYINAIGGMELYDKDRFKTEGVKLNFIQMDDDISYKQLNQSFTPGLSIIDMLMFCDNTWISEKLNNFKLL